MFKKLPFLMDQAGDAGAAGGGAAGAGGDAGAGAAGAAGAAAGATDWLAGIGDEAARSWVTTKGYKDPTALAQSAWNMEKLIGTPAEQIIKLPKETTPEAMRSVWERLGAGKTVDDYKLPVPEGDKGEFAKTAANWFHKHGVPVEMAKGLAAEWNAHITGQVTAQTELAAAKSTEQAAALAKEWGAALDQNKAIAKQAVAALGVTPEQIDGLQSVFGYDGVMKFFHNLGMKTGEASFVSGSSVQANGVRTPEQARAEIATLQRDADFAAKYLKGDTEARERMARLHKQAYPEG